MKHVLYQNSAERRSSTLEGRKTIEQVMDSDRQKELIQSIRSTDDEEVQQKLKKQLAGIKPACRPTVEAIRKAKEKAKVSKHKPTFKRDKNEEELSCIGQADFDHLDDQGLTAEDVNKKFFEKVLDELGWKAEARILMTFKTARGNWKCLFVGTPGSTLVEDIIKISAALDLEADFNVGNMSQLCFLPSRQLGDVFYYNPDLFWGEDLSFDYGVGEEFKPAKHRKPVELELFGGTGDVKVDELVANPPCQTISAEGIKEFPKDFKGAKWEDIVDAYIQLKWGDRPAIGERNNNLFELSQNLAHITDNRPEWLYQVLVAEAKSWGLNEKEIMDTIKSACKEPLKTRMSNMLERAITIAQQRNDETAALSVAPQLPADEYLHPVISMFTSRVMPFQREAVASMIFTWFATYVHDLYFKNVDNTVSESALVSGCIGESSVGKSILDTIFKIVCHELIMKTDESAARQIAWNDGQNTSDPKSKKEKRLTDLVYPVLDANATSAVIRYILYCNNLANHTPAIVHVPEVELLYNLVNDGGHINICSFIKQVFDRDRFGALRFTAGASNYSGPARVNISYACTEQKFKKMFKAASTDGTIGRQDLSIMERPKDFDGDFVYGDFDKAFKKELQPYIDRLKEFKPEVDEDGDPIPLCIPEAVALAKEINSYIREYSSSYEDNVYESYAYRTNKMCYNKIHILYILNGMKWDDSFGDFYRWNFHYSMHCKMRLLDDDAKEQLQGSQLPDRKRAKSPLASLPTTFKREEAEKVCKELGVKKTVANMLSQWKSREQVTSDDGETFTKTAKGMAVRDF